MDLSSKGKSLADAEEPGPGDFVIGFNSRPMATEVVRTRAQLRMVVIIGAILVPIAILMVIFVPMPYSAVLVTIGALISFVVWASTAFRLVKGKIALSRIGRGEAFRITQEGIRTRAVLESGAVQQVFLWDEIVSLKSETGWVTGSVLMIKANGNRYWAIPYSYLDVKQLSINQAIETFSQGQCTVVSDRPFLPQA